MTTNYYLKAILKTMLAVLALSSSTGMRAQHMQASLSHYSTENGLPSNAISSITCDDYGYVWICTWNGMARFDGYNFYTYKTGIASGIKGMHNRIAQATIDQRQNVWMKMYDGRFFVIDRQTDRIIDPFKDVNGHDQFSADYFTITYVAANGDVYIPFNEGVFYKVKCDNNGYHPQQITTNGLTVKCLVGGYRDDVWAGTDQGLRRIDLSYNTLERKGIMLDENITQLATNGYNIFFGTKSGKIVNYAYGQEPKVLTDIGREVTGLFVDSHGLIWFSDMDDGAYKLDPATGNIKHFTQRIPQPEFTSRGAEFRESMGVVWVRMNHGGYGYYNRDTDEVEYFHNDPSNPWNLSNTVYAALELPEGVIWESTSRRGLEKLELQKDNIVRIRPIPNATSPTENEIRAMYYDTQRKLLLIGNKHSTLFLNYDDGRREVITKDSNGNLLGRFYGISKDSKGNYWLCSKDNGLYYMSPTDKGGWTLKNYCHQADNPQSLSHNGAYMAIEDKSGNVWIATYGGGVNLLPHEAISNPKFLSPDNGIKDYPKNSHKKVRTIEIDNEGNVWAGTTDGILILSYKNNKVSVEKLQMPESGEQMLMSNDIVCMKCDKQGTMWLGSNGGGLACTVGKKDDIWLFNNYGAQEGIPSEEIRSITFDQRGNPWFATEYVLCSFDITNKIVTSFSYLDGVDEMTLSEGNAVTMGNGDLLFGTLDGYYLVDIKKLMASSGSLLKLQITDFLFNNEIQSPRLNKNYDYFIPSSRSVELPSRSGEFAFRFAALNYQLQHRVHYQYMLEGYDDDWHSADKLRMAFYSNVPGGTYTFKVKAYLLESPDQYDIRTMEVIVPSPFFLSKPALIIYGVVLVFLALALFYKIRSMRSRNKE